MNNLHLRLFVLGAICLLVQIAPQTVVCQSVPESGDLVLAYENQPSIGFFNTDSLMFDTSVNPYALCAKKKFLVVFRTVPFHDSAAVDENGEYDIADVDDSHVDFFLIRQLDSLAGEIRFMKIETNDSSVYLDRKFYVGFSNYIRVDTVKSYFAAMDSVDQFELMSGCYRNLASSTDPGFKVLTDQNGLEGRTDKPYMKRYSNLGLQFNLHLINIPMAWEITKGSSSVYLGVDDGPSDLNNVPTNSEQHRDLHVTSNSGNFYYSNQLSNDQKIIPLCDFHSKSTMGVAVAEENALGVVGMAPGIRAFLTLKNSTDGSNLYQSLKLPAGGSSPPHVMSCSYYFPHGTNSANRYRDAINAGVCVVGSSVNTEVKIALEETSPGFFEYLKIGGHDVDYNEPENSPLAGLFIPGSNANGSEDVKVLSVIEYEHSDVKYTQEDQNCPRGIQTVYAPRWFSDKVVGSGINKFAIGSGRIGEKSAAFVDVVVPNNLVGIHGDGSTSSYYYEAGGNSHAVPQVSAVIGLMNSVHDRLGETGKGVQKRVYDIVTFTADKILDTQPAHTAQQSIASELNNADGVLSRVTHYDGVFETNDPSRPTVRIFKIPNRAYLEKYPSLLDVNGRLKVDYTIQTNDKLKRSWAPRMGFGRVNAFRCLAHSIPLSVGGQDNAKYEYSGSEAFNWQYGHTVGARQYIHLGKFKSQTTLVLEDGGHTHSGEPEYLNNNGKTIIGSTGLQVPSDKTLVIDGILEKASGGSAKTIETTGTGLILATGWVDDVTLSGAIKATDLRINRTTTGVAMSTMNASEFFNDVWLRGSGSLVVNSGTLTLQPGSTLHLSGANTKRVVKAGAELIIKHTAKILDEESVNQDSRIVLEEGTVSLPGGKLTIVDGAEETVIDAEVVVNNGAVFHVGAATDEVHPNAYLYKVVVKTGGKIETVNNSFLQRLVSSSTTPVLVVESSTGLTIPASTSARIDAPIEIKGGGKVEVGHNATLKTGSLMVQSAGRFIAKVGATVQFLDKDNYVRGILVGEGTPENKVTFTATNEPAQNCASVSRLNYVRVIAVPDKWLYNTNTPGAAPLDQVLTSYIHIQNATFTNVFTALKNMPVLARDGAVLVPGQVRNCEFKADRSWYVDNSQLNEQVRSTRGWLYLWDGIRDRRGVQKTFVPGIPPLVKQQGQNLLKDISFINCRFHDLGGKITPQTGTYQQLSRAQDYPAMGVSLSGYSKGLFQYTTFAHLFTGVYADGALTVRECVFGALSDGVRCQIANVCNNNFSGCVNGVRSTGSVRLVDNTFGATMSNSSTPANPLFASNETADHLGHGYFQSTGGMGIARNNSLSNYVNALHATAGVIDAGDKFAFQAPNNANRGGAIVLGRNAFQGKVQTTANPYEVAAERSDIYMEMTGSVYIKCGKNQFSNETVKLRKKEGSGITLLVSTNDFGVNTIAQLTPFCLNVTPDGDELRNGQHPIDEDCANTNLIRARATEFECVQLIQPDPGAFTPNQDPVDITKANVRVFRVDIDPTVSVPSAFAAEVFDVGTYWINHDSIDVSDRLYWIDNCVASAQYHANADSAKNTLDSLLIEIGSDTLNENSLREKAILARVQLLCLDESYESAKEWLDSLRVGLFLSYDSTIVDLLSAKLGALADTTLSLAELSDSLTKITSDEVQYAKRDESGFGKRSLDLVKMNKENRLFELALRPNPSSDHLTVTYSGPKVDKLELSIASLAGAGVKQESLFKVVSGSEVTIDTSCLPIGVYVLKGYNGDSTSTTMFVVVR